MALQSISISPYPTRVGQAPPAQKTISLPSPDSPLLLSPPKMVAASNSRDIHIQAGKITCYFPSCDVRACHTRWLGSRVGRARLDYPKWLLGLTVPQGLLKRVPFWWQLCFCSPNTLGTAHSCCWDGAVQLPASTSHHITGSSVVGAAQLQGTSLLLSWEHPVWAHPKPCPAPASAVLSTSIP